jgi:flavin-dependent dehydrogenase
LIGDASGSADPTTGEGLGLAFRQAAWLAEGLQQCSLEKYEQAHAYFGRLPRVMSALLLSLDAYTPLRTWTLRNLARHPQLFADLLDLHTRAVRPSAFGRQATIHVLQRLLPV